MLKELTTIFTDKVGLLEGAVLERTFGLNGRRLTETEISEELELSGTEVRQIYKRALKQLRDPSVLNSLRTIRIDLNTRRNNKFSFNNKR